MHRSLYGVIAGEAGVGQRGRLPRIQITQRNQIAGCGDEDVLGHATVSAAEATWTGLARDLAVIFHSLTTVHAQPATPWAVDDHGVSRSETCCTRSYLLHPA